MYRTICFSICTIVTTLAFVQSAPAQNVHHISLSVVMDPAISTPYLRPGDTTDSLNTLLSSDVATLISNSKVWKGYCWELTSNDPNAEAILSITITADQAKNWAFSAEFVKVHPRCDGLPSPMAPGTSVITIAELTLHGPPANRTSLVQKVGDWCSAYFLAPQRVDIMTYLSKCVLVGRGKLETIGAQSSCCLYIAKRFEYFKYSAFRFVYNVANQVKRIDVQGAGTSHVGPGAASDEIVLDMNLPQPGVAVPAPNTSIDVFLIKYCSESDPPVFR